MHTLDTNLKYDSMVTIFHISVLKVQPRLSQKNNVFGYKPQTYCSVQVSKQGVNLSMI